MFENYFATVRRGRRIENNCTLLRNVLKVMKKPMSMREIHKEIPSIQLTNHMIETLIECKALKKEIRAEETIDIPFEGVVLEDTLVTNDDGSISARLAWNRSTKPIKIYNFTLEDHEWVSAFKNLYGIRKVQVYRAYYEWIGD